MVNKRAMSVYQSDRVLLFIDDTRRFGSRARRTAFRRNSTEYVDVQISLRSAAGRRMRLPCRSGSGGGPRLSAADGDLCRAAAADRAGAHGLCRALADGRRLHRIPVRRSARRTGSAADVSAAAVLLRAAAPDARHGAAAGIPGRGRLRADAASALFGYSAPKSNVVQFVSSAMSSPPAIP